MTDLNRNRVALAIILAGCCCFVSAGCRSTARQGIPLTGKPSHNREWDPMMSQLPHAEFAGSLVEIENVRDFRYASEDIFVPNYEDRVYDMTRLQSVDYIVVPFNNAPDLAHTMVSFGFSDGQQVVVSAEARREKGESYTPLGGFLQQFELMYVVADERDVIPLRTRFRKNEVFVYRTRATPDQARQLFTDMMARVNQIHDTPEFYHTVNNNCTTNIRNHLERIAPGRVPWSPAVLFPGRSDEYAYQLGLIDMPGSFQEIRQRANITQLANLYSEQPEFSQKIRQYR